MQFSFENYCLDADRRELRRGAELIAVGPKVFDLLFFLIQNREQVVTRDDLLQAVWTGRIVSESTLTSHINAVRKAIADTGKEQRLIRTVARKGVRFVGEVQDEELSASASVTRPNIRGELAPCLRSGEEDALSPWSLERRRGAIGRVRQTSDGVSGGRREAMALPVLIKHALRETAYRELDAQYGALYRTEDFLERKAEAEGRLPVYLGK